MRLCLGVMRADRARPAPPNPRSTASPGLPAHTVASKHPDGLLLYCQEQILTRIEVDLRRSGAGTRMSRHLRCHLFCRQ